MFDILLEGKTVLNDYEITTDHAKITPFDADELEAATLGEFTGIVKRFMVDVRGQQWFADRFDL